MKTNSTLTSIGSGGFLAGVALVFWSALPTLADRPLVTSTYDERNYSLVYNSQQSEYLLGLTQNGTPVVQRLLANGSPTNSLAAPWVSPGYVGGGEIQLAYNPHLNQYLAVMNGVAPYPWPNGPMTPMVFAAVLDANANLTGMPFLLTLGGTYSSYSVSPHLQGRHYRTINAAFNTLANEYLVTYQVAGANYSVYSQRVSEAGALLGSANGLVSAGSPGTHAIAYGPVTSPETPNGRYLFVHFDPSAPINLIMLGSAGEVVTNAIPFDWGPTSGNESCPDVVYANIPGHTPSQVFLVVWEDENNKDYWNPTVALTGVWGGYVDASKLAYANWNTPDYKAFFLSGSCLQNFDGWDPRIAYDPSTLMFHLASRQTPTTGGSCPAPLNYHVSLTSFSGTKLAYLYYPAGYGPSPVISQMTGAYPGNELPRHPTVAVNSSGKFVVAWDDARNSGTGNQRDIYGTSALNDDCSGAIALSENVYFTQNTAGAGDDGYSTCLGRTRTKGVWFTYTPALTGKATVDTCPSDFNTDLEIFTGECGALGSIGCNDFSSSCLGTNYRGSFSFSCTAGTTYRIWAGGDYGASGNLQIRAYATLPPVNDDCSGAIALSENVYYAEATTNATDEGWSTCLGRTMSKGVWFTYTPSQTGTATVDTCPSDFDTMLEVFSGDCGTLTSLGCNDDSTLCSSPVRSLFNFPCTAGTTYRIWAGGYNGGSGNLQIRAHYVAGSGPVTLLSCSGTGGDHYNRGFYVPQYPGVSLSSAQLKLSAATAGNYALTLTVRSNTYDGPVLAASTSTVTLSGSTSENQPVLFTFPSTPIAKYSRVCFILSLISGPSTAVYYSVPAEGGCNEVVETEGTTPPLDTFRRYGVDLVLVGVNDPNSDLRLAIGRQPAGLYLYWKSIPGRTYIVQSSDNLQVFNPLQSGIAATPPTNTFGPIAPLPASRQFYRLVLEAPPAP